ncbi:MAG: TIGR02281 family clan AA aspartic protease [Pseudomonadales bacterium]|jgi:aspartyl protease family protein
MAGSKIAGFSTLLILCCLTTPLQALELEIDVLGLFKNSAMLNIAGQETLLKVGERSKQGVLLVSADSQGAVIEFAGEQHELDLSSRIAASFEKPQESTVKILLNESGQYKTRGTINGRSVEFLVDTGANIIAMNSEMAASLGLKATEGRPVQVATASGMAQSHLIELEEVQVGSIRATRVRAAIMQGAYPVDILLGMSFLQDVKITESSGVMQLTGKF